MGGCWWPPMSLPRICPTHDDNDRTCPMPKMRDPSSLLTADQVRALLDYDPVTGILTWRTRPGQDRTTKSWNSKHARKQAGTPKGNYGYVTVGLFDRPYKAHRVIWVIMTGGWPEGNVDHR